jgi:hypothetical protein
MSNDRDQTWIDLHDKKAIQFMEGWWGGQNDPLYAIASSGGNYAWVFEDAIANLEADLAKVKKSGKKYKLGKGTFTKAEIDELKYIRDALADALEGARGEGDMDEFTYAYFETALWSSNDESDPETGGDPLDQNYGIGDFAPEARKDMITDAKDFQKRFGHLIESAGGDWGQAGHDFWLTRNGHGAGFWDGDWPEPQATELTNASKQYGECNLYVGDDGLIYTYECGRPPRARAAAPRRQALKQRAPRRAFRIGQDVEMISNPSNMGHVVGFDPDGSVMVQWTNPPGGAVSGVSPDNLRGLPPGFAERAQASSRYPKPPRPAPGPFVTPRAGAVGAPRSPVVADFNTFVDLVTHAADQLGATHVAIELVGGTGQAGPGTLLFFPRGGQYPYEEARVRRKAGYWHAEGPGSRTGISQLPSSAVPIENWLAARGQRRAAAEPPRHRRRAPRRQRR